MALRLFAPGTRKGNKYWIALGWLGGRYREISTRTTDKESAERIAAKFADSVLNAEGPPPERRTFQEAVDAYVRFREPSDRDRGRLERICAELGGRDVTSIVQDDIVDVARRLWPGASPASLNRHAIAPISAVMHYAAKNRWCARMTVSRFREEQVLPRALSEKQAQALIQAAEPGDERRLILLLFGLGQRITDTLALRWEQVDLKHRVVQMRVGKINREIVVPIPPALAGELDLTPKAERRGRLVRWETRWGAAKVCRAIGRRAKVAWSPHRARHTVGTLLARSGAPLRAIMDALGHASVKSAMWYQASSVSQVRTAQRALRSILGGKK